MSFKDYVSDQVGTNTTSLLQHFYNLDAKLHNLNRCNVFLISGLFLACGYLPFEKFLASIIMR